MIKKILAILVALTVLMAGPAYATGAYTTHNKLYKPNYGAYGVSDWTKFTDAFDAVDKDIYDLETNQAALATLINSWAIEDNIVTLIPGTCTYSDNNTFTLSGDYTSRFTVGKVVQIQVAAGMVYSTVASSSYAAPTTTVNLNDTVLTNPITRVYVVATRDGLWPNGPGYVVAADYGTDQAALAIADGVAAAAAKQLVIGQQYNITSDLTLTSALKVMPVAGGAFAIATTKTLTINGPVDVGNYRVFTLTGTGKALFGGGLVAEFSAYWWGAVGDGTTDDSVAVQAAIDAAYATPLVGGYGPLPKVVLPGGPVKIGTCLNLSGKRNMWLKGDSRDQDYGTYLKGSTGAGKAVIDCTGSRNSIIENIGIQADTSTIGIITGYITGTYKDTNHLEFRNVSIFMGSSPTANSNLGTIGIANKSGENVKYNGIKVFADVPVILSDTTSMNWITNPGPNTFTLTSDYATFAAMSCGVHTFENNCILISPDKQRPCIAMYNANTVNLGNSYLGIDSLAPTGTCSAPIFINQCLTFNFTGHVEQWPSFMAVPGILSNANITASFTPDATAGPPPIIDLSTDGALRNCNVSLAIPSGTSDRRYIYSSDVAPTGITDNTTLLVDTLTFTSITSIQPDTNFLSNGLCRNLTIGLIGGSRVYGGNPSASVYIPVTVVVNTATVNLYTFGLSVGLYKVYIAQDGTTTGGNYAIGYVSMGTASGTYVAEKESAGCALSVVGAILEFTNTTGGDFSIKGSIVALPLP